MDKKLSEKEIRRKKTVGYMKVAVPVAAITVICIIVAVTVQPALKSDLLDISEVQSGTLSVSVGATGSVVPFYEESVTSPIATKILEVYKKSGELVHKGDTILRLDLADNALVDIDNVEVPILDGSAKPYIDAMWQDGKGIVEQDAPRKYLELASSVEIKNEETGAYVRIEPADVPSFDLTIDFNSKVLGVQSAHWDPSVTYAEEIGICRTFVFFHEIEYLFNNNLIKGGDVDNAVVIVEHPVSQEQLGRMASLFNVPMLGVRPDGYLDNITLRFPNECARHKLLDLMGDLRLAGGFLKARVTAYKAGHTINTRAAAAVSKSLK